MEASVKVLMNQLDKGFYVYGVNTGFGGSADSRTNRLHALQAALLQPTQAGVLVAADKADGSLQAHVSGLRTHAMPAPWVRAAIAVRCNSFVRGHSAVSPDIARALLELLERGITPVVPLCSSVSAPGDLMPLEYIAGAIEGSLDVHVQEGLCLVNRTASSAALAALAIFEAQMLAVLVQALSGMAVEALLGNSESFHPFISAVRPHAGQIECARNVRQLLQGSRLAQNVTGDKDRKKSGLIQDRYALRSVPQWLGPQLEDLELARRQVTIELSSSCDNPLVDHQTDDVYYGCNFQAASVTSAMEKTSISLQMFGKIIFAQATEMMNARLNNGLPTNLAADDANLSFTTKGIDTSMAAYMAELTYMAHPISSHVQAAEMHNQSVNSISLVSGRFAMDAIEVLSIMCACHLYVSCQALDLRSLHFRFIERACKALQALNARLFPSVTREQLARLDSAVGAHFTSCWAQTNTLSIEDRCRVTAQNALEGLIAILAETAPGSGPSAADLARWQDRATSTFNDLFTTTSESLAKNPHTLALLGMGSKVLYQTVREMLGVPFHRGLIEHPTIYDSKIDERDKKTIGSWIYIIYEAIRSGQLFDSLARVLETTSLIGDTHDLRTSRSRGTYKL